MQSEHTHENGIVRSRLDRAYFNQHVSLQLQKHCECVALPFPLGLSAHRPISFSRRTPSNNRWALACAPVPSSGVEHELFPETVSRIFRARIRDCNTPTEFETLEVLKVSARLAARELSIRHSEREMPTTEEKISSVFGYLHALEHNDFHRQQKHASRYPHIYEIVGEAPSAATGALRLRNHALELCREDLTSRLQELHQTKDSLSDYDYSNHKEHLLTRLKKLIPGGSMSLNAIHSPNGVSTDPREIADALREHWGKVFHGREVDLSIYGSWLAEDGFTFAALGVQQNDPRWTIKQKHVREAILEAKESAPGPDGIPYCIRKKIEPLATPIIHNVAVAMQNPNTVVPKDFNRAFLFCLPKKPSGQDPVHGDFYAPQNTRPLSLVDTVNRLIANSYRKVLEPLTNQLVSDMQQGFLKGRSILRNVLEIDWESMTVSLSSSKGALILFDFEAAFPSLSQEFLMNSLQAVGLPPGIMQVIKFLYQNNECVIKLKGELFDGLPLTSGVRQGCPLSPLLFVVEIDILLRRLQRLFPGSLARAFADDNAWS